MPYVSWNAAKWCMSSILFSVASHCNTWSNTALQRWKEKQQMKQKKSGSLVLFVLTRTPLLCHQAAQITEGGVQILLLFYGLKCIADLYIGDIHKLLSRWFPKFSNAWEKMSLLTSEAQKKVLSWRRIASKVKRVHDDQPGLFHS